MEYVWLSHVITGDSPLYGGQKDGIRIAADKSIDAGDSCNTSTISMPVHAGTHVDLPRHFIADGRAVDDLPVETWIFKYPAVLEIQVSPGQVIQPSDIDTEKFTEKTDIFIFSTGFEKLRGIDTYWEKGPGIAAEAAAFLRSRYPYLRAVGMDFISVSSLVDREAGRRAHREFLKRDILLIEDMKLGEIVAGRSLAGVVCMPLRVAGGDGAPCTILGLMEEKRSINNAV